MKRLLNFLNLHIAGVVVLLILNLTLGVRLFFAWNTLRDAGPDQLSQQQSALRALQLEMSPVHGLPEKVSRSRSQANEFYQARFPAVYSTISAAINDLATKSPVHLSNLAYTPTPALPGLVGVRLDSSISGEYAPVMRFINGLERSKTFFLINGLTLAGQQGGLVNLRLRLVTYLHTTDPNLLAPASESQQEQGEEQPR